jgi:hypothetical protein
MDKQDINGAKQSIDSLELVKLIDFREQAMIAKDIHAVMSQFTEGTTWINSQGYLFEGEEEVRKFHNYLMGNDSLDYNYEAGQPRVNVIDEHNALVYYSWKMFWYRKDNPLDTVNKEIGLMTLNAFKPNNEWKWIAVTNQHTPWFYPTIDAAKIE